MSSITLNEEQLKFWKEKSVLIHDLAEVNNSKTLTLTKKLLFGNSNHFTDDDWSFLKNLLTINIDWAKSHNINDLLEPVIIKTGKTYTKSQANSIIDYLLHVNEKNLKNTLSRRRNTRNKKNTSANYRYNNNNNSNNGLSKKQKKYPKANVKINNNNNNRKPYGKSKKNGKSKGSRRY
jgi:hypothetical protein